MLKTLVFACLVSTGFAEVVINEIMYYSPVSPGQVLENEAGEFLELYNTGTENQDLAGWRISGGIDFTFSTESISPGQFLVIAANPAILNENLEEGIIATGPWVGKLSNSGEKIRLRDEQNQVVDEVDYADDGNWSRRVRGVNDNGFRGWAWANDHDGGGKSLELINPNIDNRLGQAWSASAVGGGSPGIQNGSFSQSVPPFVMEPMHRPEIPRSDSPIAVSAVIIATTTEPVSVMLHYRQDGQEDYSSLEMKDDGKHADEFASDTRYAASIPPQPNETIIEYYISVSGSGSGSNASLRRYPNTIDNEVADLLFQVLDEESDSGQPRPPRHYIVMTEKERSELEEIGEFTSEKVNSQMNATFISVSESGISCRYNVGVRNRGHTSRWKIPHNYRVNFRSDEPWGNVTSINLNATYHHRQIVGNRLHQLAGLPANDVIPATLRINGANPSSPGDPSFGYYAHVEAYDGSYAENHFPKDPDGNLYTAVFAGLEAHLESLNSYRGRYKKQTNAAKNDYSDLQALTDVLFNSPDEDYITNLESTIHVEQWLRFLALHVLLGNRESSIGRKGEGDDFGLYRGIEDRRFYLIPKDLDSILSRGVGLSSSIWGAAQHPAIKRFIEHPAIVPRYLRALLDLSETIFSPEAIDATLEMLVGDTIPDSELQLMKVIARERRALVLSQIPTNHSIDSNLPVVAEAHQTTEASTQVSGVANAALTNKVLVNGREATYSPLTGIWLLEDYPLFPGENRVTAVAFSHEGEEISHQSILIRRETGNAVVLPANLRESLTLNPEDGPFLVESGSTIVRPGAVLTIKPGTTVYFNQDLQLLVAGGTLVAEGSPDARIQFSRNPGVAESYAGIAFTSNAVGNIVSYADVSFAGSNPNLNRNVRVSASEVLFDNVSFKKSVGRVFWVSKPQLRIQNCEFPELLGNECIAGFGSMTGQQYLIVENNIFGSTSGYSDIIDWSGGKRPGPILQVLNNVFLGGSDEALDLDGIDAHIEGNLFYNIKKDNGSTSTANAISTGGQGDVVSDLTIVRNVFVNCDHALLLKNGSRATFEQNTVVESDESGISFGEPERGVPYGDEAIIRGSIFKNNLVDFDNLIPEVDLIIEGSRVAEEWHENGTSNISSDPFFLDEENGDYRLASGSPAAGGGPNGLDMGAFVPAGVNISGFPVGTTGSTSLMLPVYGPGIVSYRYALNDQPFGEETPIGSPISLQALPDGTHSVRAIGKNSAGVWQDAADAFRSRDWTVDTSGGRIRLSEVLAASMTTFKDGDVSRDYVEIENHGSGSFDLSGYALTDNLSEPQKFVFPENTSLAPSHFLLVLGESGESPGMTYLGYGLSSTGESLFLLDPIGEVVDSVSFGPQVTDLSIGRVGIGDWKLNRATPGSPNIKLISGTPERVTINEWSVNPGVAIAADFIELFNPDPFPVSISGLYLTDNPGGNPTRQSIGPLSFIGSSQFVIFSRSSNPKLEFGLAAEQGIISLMSKEGKPLDQVVYHSMGRDFSGGRGSDGSNAIRAFPYPTPGNSNGEIGPPDIRESIFIFSDEWRYNEDGIDLGTEWKNVDFDDGSWKTGPGLIGKERAVLEEPIRTVVNLTDQHTIYFRNEFLYSGDPEKTTLELSCLIDDGAVFYLNGEELFRFLMPEGEIGYATPGKGVGNAALAGPFKVDSTQLRNGLNVLSVEVHQSSTSSNDFVFGLEMDATYPQEKTPELLDSLRIVEIHYDPADGRAHEFIELRNISSNSLDLEGVRFVAGIEFEFPEYELRPGERVVLAGNPEEFRSKYGEDLPVLGPYIGKLSNGGEELVLFHKSPLDLAIQRFEYNDAWYPSTDGAGKSLQIRHPYLPNLDWGKKSNWRPSEEDGGSPGITVPWCDLEYPNHVDSTGVSLQLAATVTDEGLPSSDEVTYKWSQLSGPAMADFGNMDSSATTVEFSEPGVYLFSLLSSLGDQSCESPFSISVGAGYDQWLSDHFTPDERASTSISGELADPDGDGLKNFLEYAFGLAPRSADKLLIDIQITAEDTVISFERPSALSEIDYFLESSNDLKMWLTVEDAVEQLETPPNDEGIERISLRIPPITPKIGRRFLRLGAQRQQ